MTHSITDQIVKQIEIKAPIDCVWRALSDYHAFGEWFGVRLDGPFVAGRSNRGQITHPGYEHISMEIRIESIEPLRRFAFYWHPYAIEPDVDYSVEPETLVEFTVEATPAGTLLKVTESGFDAIPAGRRDEALRMNDGGWTEQVKNIAKYAEAKSE